MVDKEQSSALCLDIYPIYEHLVILIVRHQPVVQSLARYLNSSDIPNFCKIYLKEFEDFRSSQRVKAEHFDLRRYTGLCTLSFSSIKFNISSVWLECTFERIFHISQLYILEKERGEYLLYLFMHERAYLCLRKDAQEKILYIAMNKKLL